MKAVYINLDSATARRAQLEAGFGRVAHPGWKLERFSAIAASAAAAIPGRLEPQHKGCFASHRQLIADNLGDEQPLLVLEDDALFSRATFPVLNAMLSAAGDWDVLLTDVALFDAAVMTDFARLRDAHVRDGRYITFALRNVHFAGATAYLVRGSAKAKLHRVLAAATSLDLPYDIFLRQRSDAGDLKIMGCFPFVTSISPAADVSQIRTGAADLHLQVIDAFRRLMFVERDVDACRSAVERIDAQLDDSARLFGVLLGAMTQHVGAKG